MLREHIGYNIINEEMAEKQTISTQFLEKVGL